MSNTTVVPLRQPDAVNDPLTAVLRDGAPRLLAQAVEAEADAFLTSMQDARLADGRERIVRHGHGPERVIQTGIGPVEVQRVKLRDRASGENGERIRFTSAILGLAVMTLLAAAIAHGIRQWLGRFVVGVIVL